MPKWGLTEAQRAARPWGLATDLLKPGKTITDPVHGDVYLTNLERLLVDSPPMQRLRRVRQLGTTHLVYPSATHTRFSHSLGTLRAAQDLMDAVVDNRTGPRHYPDLLDEWANADVPTPRKLPGGDTVRARELDVRVGEATVLARLGGLLHDLCHVPLGHTIEDDLKVLTPHDENDERFDALWLQLNEEARRAIEQAEPDLFRDLKRLIISKKGADDADGRYPFVADIVGNTICADLMDYLRRDHAMTGLPMALGRRFMNEFYVMPSDHPHFARRMVVRITRDGLPRADIVTELVKYLRFRYELTERVLTHHAKTAADAMIGKLLEMWHDQQFVEFAAADHADVVATTGRVDIATIEKAIAQRNPDEQSTSKEAKPERPLAEMNSAVGEIERKVRASFEKEFMTRSDDGLLEHLAALGHDASEERVQAVSALARAVLDRNLYKMIGRTGDDAVHLATLTYDKYGSAATRRRLEREAAHYAGLSDGWKVVLWIPNPGMRFKVAEVLVDDGEQVNGLAAISPQGEEIVKQHQSLWALSVYVHPEVFPADVASRVSEVDILLGWLKDEMRVPLKMRDGGDVRGLAELAVDRVTDVAGLTRDQRKAVLQLVPAAMGAEQVFRERLRTTWRQAREVKPELEEEPPGNL